MLVSVLGRSGCLRERERGEEGYTKIDHHPLFGLIYAIFCPASTS